ncbi:hypothetical protein B1759_06065 [Rubrivirga sp. SAORIC476]|uniref:hypothetical protein n=1 Tax=Rubrivirga sp. SAORIC476 TaxID=1961794 RepID=UPI000BA8FD89|nr:hypothetical protein [Rubrivirga sp. SAORIC476]PAP80928.1 hypothetical protein B1759_06065 [Rubrivirga sp. SAORIC476]
MLRLGLLVALFVAAPAWAQPAAEVPVERVILFTSGVGYFEHGGRVSGDADVTLRFGTEALNDVLKSLVVEDRGGRVAGVVYPTQAPIERTLQSFAIDLSNGPGLSNILRQVRGAEVEVSTPSGTVRGTVVAVDRQTREAGDTAIEVDVLSLLTAGGLVSVRLDTARGIAFTDPALQAELAGALAALAEDRGGDRKPVRVQFRGRGARDVRMGYVIESPVWKTSYRLVLADDDGTLQGWALVENPTEADWTDIDLTLVSGRPVSFVTDLYTPRFIDRPVVTLADDAVVRPESYAAGARERAAAPPPPPPAPEPARMGAVLGARGGRADEVVVMNDAMPLDPTGSVVAQGTAGDFGELFAYRLGSVTLPRRGSAMLPIVSDAVGVERLSIFTGAAGRHPMRGVRLTNTTGASLRGGPMTVLDDGYAGDALLPDLPEGDERLLTFAVDQDVLVDPYAVPGAASVIETARLVDGVLTIQRQGRTTRGYRLENRGSRRRVVLVEAPRQPGARLIAPTAAEESTPDAYRFRVPLAPGATDSLVVTEAQTLSERIGLASLSPERILSLARADGEIPADVRAALRRAADLRRDLAETERREVELRNELATIERDQTRIRGNLEAIDNDTDYGRRLLATLDEQETRIEAIRAEQAEVQALLNRQREALRISVR